MLPCASLAIFRWVRGELIGKGTYGRVYLALNATTGEMIAVKQVEIPRTASDKDDSRQVSVVEALKLESETFAELDHPNIVSYLGFEETPTFLSMYVSINYIANQAILTSNSASWSMFPAVLSPVVFGSTVGSMSRLLSPSLGKS